MQITESLFLAYCQCPYKAFLKSKGEVGEVVDYEVIQKEADARFREQAIERLLQSHAESHVSREPASLRLAVKEDARLIIGARVEAQEWLSRSMFSNGLSIVMTTSDRSTYQLVFPTSTS